jgi:hypothetical protein
VVRWLAIVILASQLFSPVALAQDAGTPIDPVIEEQAPSPTPLPVEPEPTVTSIPPTPSPTSIPEPTAAPAASLSYQLAAQPECVLAADQPSELASGGAIDYACTSRIEITGEHIAAAGITITWEIAATVTPGWEARLLPPARSAEEQPVWTEFLDGRTEFTFDHVDPAGSVTEPGAVGTVATLEYRVRIVRPACLFGEPVVELDHAATVTSPAASAVDLGAGTVRDPLVIAPALAAVASPSVKFDGGLNFGTITATAAGLSQTRIEGTLGVTISGLDTACGTWNLQLSATPIVDANGEIRDGFALLFGECDLVDGCHALTVEAGPDAPASYATTLTFTLQTPLHAALGALGTTLDATLIAAAD